jgi:hypothetical protein
MEVAFISISVRKFTTPAKLERPLHLRQLHLACIENVQKIFLPPKSRWH